MGEDSRAYYLNTLRAWRADIMRDLRLGDRRMQALLSSGSSSMEGHAAAMQIRQQMLELVEKAIADA